MKNYFPKLLITGGMGQLANALFHHSDAKSFKIIACSREQLDICNQQTIAAALKEFSPDIIINTAAYTAVDKAEQERNRASVVNFLGAKNLAMACQEHHIPLIHLSTDYIFDGVNTSPYTEKHSANPINFYGETKWLGEEMVRKYCEQHIILRVSGVFSEYGNNFLKTILRLTQEKNKLRVVSDQITCPTYAGDIASAIFEIAKQFRNPGTYHFASQAPTSWHGFATAIIEAAKLQHEIEAISTAEYPTAAQRPTHSVLDCQKIAETFGIFQPSWRDGIKKAIKEMVK